MPSADGASSRQALAHRWCRWIAFLTFDAIIDLFEFSEARVSSDFSRFFATVCICVWLLVFGFLD